LLMVSSHAKASSNELLSTHYCWLLTKSKEDV
jgi:hypothetical protein